MWITASEVARMMGKSRGTIVRWANLGIVIPPPDRRLPPAYYREWDYDKFREWLKANGHPPNPAPSAVEHASDSAQPSGNS
jgi:hypothetical protein